MPRIIETMQLLGYEPNKGGVCFGIAMMGTQAIARNQSQAFIDRINFISNSSEESIKSLAEPFDRKTLKDRHEKKMDLCCFFDELSIYQGKGCVNSEFKSIVPDQCVDNVKKIGDPQNNDHCIYPVIKQNVVNLFTREALFDFIMKTKRQLLGHSFSIIFSHSPKDHASQIGFDAKEKKWFSSDHDYLVTGDNNFDDIDKVINNIFSSHKYSYDGIHSLAVSLDVLLSDEKATEEIDLSVLETNNFNLEKLTNTFNTDALSHLISCYERAFRFDEIVDIFDKLKTFSLSEKEKIQLIESVHPNGLTLFHHLIGKDEADALHALLTKVDEMQLSANAKVNLLDKQNNDPSSSLLIFALKYKSEKVINVLADNIKAIKDENTRAKLLAVTNPDGLPALLIATANQPKEPEAVNQHQEAIVALISAICSVKNNPLRAKLLESKREDISALLLAAKNGFTESVDALITGISSLENNQLKAKLLAAADSDGVTALLIAAANGHKKVVEKLIQGISDLESNELKHKLLDAKDDDGVSALLSAATYGHTEVVAALIKAISDMKNDDVKSTLLEAKSNCGLSALLVAAEEGHEEIVKTITAAICNIKDDQLRAKLLEAKRDDGSPALLIAAENEHLETVNILISAIYSIKDQQIRSQLLEAKDNDSIPLLLRAVAKERIEITKALINAIRTIKDNQLRAKLLEAKDGDGVSALLMAEENGHNEIITLLTKEICDIDDDPLRARLLEAKCDSVPVLLMALRNGHAEIAKTLIKAICTVGETQLRANLLEARDPNGLTALLMAAAKGRKEVAEVLIKAISDIENDQLKAKLLQAKSNNGVSALLIASENGRKDVVEMLISAIKGIKNSQLKVELLESKRIDGESALSMAIVNGHHEIAQILTDAIFETKMQSTPKFSNQ